MWSKLLIIFVLTFFIVNVNSQKVRKKDKKILLQQQQDQQNLQQNLQQNVQQNVQQTVQQNAIQNQQQKQQQNETTIDFTKLVDLCPVQMTRYCTCKRDFYQGYNLKENRKYFITNCSNAGLNDTKILKYTPEETEILIFTNNYLETLPKYLFDDKSNYDRLMVIDLSNNQIENIKSNSFYKVKYLKKLILNNNKLQLNSRNFQAKMFNNFENLEELYLKNALAPVSKIPKTIGFMQTLNTMLMEAELTHLKILNLEENSIISFPTPFIFCSLPSLQKVYLAKNLIDDFKLNLTCTPKLRLIDLTENQFTTLTNSSFAYLESGKTIFHINLENNGWRCDCNLRDFVSWINKTQVFVLGRKYYTCKSGYPLENKGKLIMKVDKKDLVCDPNQAFLYGERYENYGYLVASYSVMTCLIFVLVVLIGVFIFSNKDYISVFVSNLRQSKADRNCEYASLKKAPQIHLHHHQHPSRLYNVGNAGKNKSKRVNPIEIPM